MVSLIYLMTQTQNQQQIFLSLQSVFYNHYNSFIKNIIVFSLNKIFNHITMTFLV